MKIFTKSVFAAVALMAGMTTASAQTWQEDADNWRELTADDWHQWKGETDAMGFEACNKSATIVMDEADPTKPAAVSIGQFLNEDRGAGSAIWGAENVDYNSYADISDYDYLIIMGTCSAENPGPGMRIMCNRIHHEGAWKQVNTNFFSGWGEETNEYYDADMGAIAIPIEVFKTKTVEQNGDSETELARHAEIEAGIVAGAERVDDFVHLHVLKNAWGGAFPVNVSGIYVWKAGATGIKDVKNNDNSDIVYYNLAGQRVNNPQKGMFIKNGKKIIVK